MPNVTRISEWANDRGVDVQFDVYPYTAGSAGLTQLIPDWAHEGGRDALLERLRDAGTRARLRDEVLAFGREWDRIYVTTMATEANRPLEGKTLAEIGGPRGVAPVEVALRPRCSRRGDRRGCCTSSWTRGTSSTSSPTPCP